MKFNFRFPSISGQTDHEKIAQIQNYLYQLVEQLHFSLNTPDNTVQQAITTQQTSSNVTQPEMADYVTDIGQEQGWVYRKWNSKVYDMFGTFTVTATSAGTATGGMFLSEQFSIVLPFSVSTIACSGTASNNATMVSPAKISFKGIAFKLLCPEQISVGDQFTVRLKITGNLRTVKIKPRR